MDRNRVLEKIQKALNLANDKGATPGEAAAALRSAQRMMEKFDVKEAELGIVGYGFETVHTTIQCKAMTKLPPDHIRHMASLLCRAFGVKCFYRKRIPKSDLNWSIEYYGRQDKIVMAGYTQKVLARSIDKSWNDQLKASPALKKVKGGRYSFWLGFLSAVDKQVMDLALTDEEKQAMEDLLKNAELVVEYVKDEDIKKAPEINGEAARAGLRAAKDFSLHRPVN